LELEAGSWKGEGGRGKLEVGALRGNEVGVLVESL